MPTRPNILFLMSDEHRYDVSGFAGDRVVRTPVLDSLAAEGVVFDNAYTPSPICVPARQCMMAGQLPETCGCRVYGDDLEPFSMTFAKRFAQYGYHTVCAGKLHHMGADQMQGWTKKIGSAGAVAPRYIEGLLAAEMKKYTPEPGTGKWTNQKEIEHAGVGEGPQQARDRYTMEGALQFIEDYFASPLYDRPQSHRPLLLKVSLVQPHYPFLTDRDRFNYYLNRVPIYQEERSDHPKLAKTQAGPPVEATARDIRRATAAYYGMIDAIDEYYGHILEALEAVGQDLDDWIIIYTSDHGDMLGEHGVWEKRQFYEGAVRVPLIIRWPRGFAGNRRVGENVSLCDLFATLCDLCGIEVPEGLDSRSLAPLLRGESEGWDNVAISQYGRDELMIKRDDLKYIFFGADLPEVLFDHSVDAGEGENLIERPGYGAAVEAFREAVRRIGLE
ncbi:MAG: sulfatase-like hydrolase/transferase [Candidatus Sumerlaeota bacterium]